MTRAQLALTFAFISGLVGFVCSASAQEVRLVPGSNGRVGEVIEVFVDERGDIYKELRYHGVVPSLRDDLRAPRSGKGKRVKHPKVRRAVSTLSWVGFQQMRFSSRVFIQTDHLSHYTIQKPDPRRIVIFLDGAKIPSRQTLRPLITSQYQGSVAAVKARRVRGGAEVTITLSRAAGYLYKQEGRYVFIDIER